MFPDMENYQDQQKKLILEIEKGYLAKKAALNPGSADDFANDPRLALVCLYFVPEEVQKVILNKIILPLRAADPAPYYYPRNLSTLPSRISATFIPLLIIQPKT